MLIVRKIYENEFELIKTLSICALKDAPYAFGGTLEDAIDRTIDQYMSDAKRWAYSEESTVFIAFDYNQAIGKAGGYFEAGSDRAFLCSMWVDPNHRKKGIGKEIVLTVVSWLYKRGAPSVYAWVANNNISAVKFYESLGFIETDETAVLPSNLDELETLYVLSLKANKTLKLVAAKNAVIA